METYANGIPGMDRPTKYDKGWEAVASPCCCAAVEHVVESREEKQNKSIRSVATKDP
jgi:hypothetical protein